ncbi:MAG: hypothetical protein DCC65_04675 [Planctomycetota bacterium]|nr:MAG: hypothetical protein DCC65_04675 [Planctomycetota bacterium]
MWSILTVMSFGLLAQSPTCSLDAVISILRPDGDANSNGVDDDANSNGTDDDSNSNGTDDDANSNGTDDDNSSALRIVADLTGPGPAHGDAEYREEGARRSLKVELEDAAAGSTHDVLVRGILIGQLTIGALGEGELEFDTNIEPGHLPWPANLPTELTPGTQVQVGPASGVLGS